MRIPLLFAVCLMLIGCVSAGNAGSYAPQEGDILFQSLPHMSVIDAIEGCTHSAYSHCGIVVKRDNVWQVLEAIGPVKFTHLTSWTRQGRNNAFAVTRLKSVHQAKAGAMIAAAEKYVGLPYDIQYEMDDGKIYCSELIYKAFKSATGQSMGRLVKLGDLDWQPHVAVIRAIAGDPPPLERQMITPRDLAKAEQLEEVLPLAAHAVTAP